MTERTNIDRTPYLESSLATFLTDWSPLSAEDALEALYRNDFEHIMAWEPFDDYTGEALADLIEGQMVALMTAFVPRETTAS